MLRNLDPHAHEFLLDVGSAWELPSGSATAYTLRSPWAEDAGKPELTAVAGTSLRLELQPFEVVVLEARASDSGR
ncbi:MAG: hypothetical protein MUF48_22545 [Pirellulaceae bacterium]|jgi:hypothetical protein|nr:hypothetical protein [Pirellulaceae bacterium]